MNSIPLFCGATYATLCMFAAHFLRTKIHAKKSHWVLLIVSVLSALVAASVFGWGYRHAIQFASGITVIASITVLAVSVLSFKKGVLPKLFAISWAPFLLGAVVIVLRNAGYLPTNFFTAYGIQIGSMVGVLFFSAALAERFRRLYSEREESKRRTLMLTQIAERNLVLAEQAQQVAHDIRSPIALLNAIAKDEASDGPHRERIRLATLRIREVAAELLQTTRSGQVRPQSCNAYTVLQGLVKEKRIEYGERHDLEFNLRSGTPSAICAAGSAELRRVMSNILNNSAEAIIGRGSISIRVVQGLGFIEISVTDSGCGIPEEQLSTIGRRGITYGKPGGFGLGLSYVRTKVSSWGGEVRIKSVVGKGTRISILIPALDTHSAAEENSVHQAVMASSVMQFDSTPAH